MSDFSIGFLFGSGAVAAIIVSLFFLGNHLSKKGKKEADTHEVTRDKLIEFWATSVEQKESELSILREILNTLRAR